MSRFFSRSFLSRWFGGSKPAATVSRTAFRRMRLAVERLEDRCVPSVVTVTSATDDPSDRGSLRYALNNATPGEVIDFAPNVRTIDLSNTLTISVSLAITNDQGVGPVTIDGDGQFVDLIFSGKLSASAVTASLSGLIIADGNGIPSGTSGGAIANWGFLTVNNTTFSDNSGGDYGSVFNDGVLAVNDCTFSSNSATDGGGILNSGWLTVSECTFSNNSASFGGGIYNHMQATVNNTTFFTNSALAAGSAGSKYGGGGGIYNDSGTLLVSNCTFSKNTASAATGGGVINYFGSLTVSNSTFSSNSATEGGGIYNDNGTLTVNNSTLSGNSTDASANSGGGIYVNAATNSSFVALNGDIVVGNVNTYAVTAPDDIAGLVGLYSTDNLIGTGGSGGLIDGENDNQVAVSVADVGLGPLANNGGPTQTFAIGPGSLAIGSGVTQTIATTDQRGIPRPIGRPSDVGAYQYSEDLSIKMAGGSPQNTIIGTPFGTALQVSVVDDAGNPVANIPVTFAAPATGPTGTFNALTTVPTDALGIATAPTLTANHILGTFTVSATVGGVASPAGFILTNTAVPTLIRAIAGTPQHAAVNTAYKAPLQARVTDSHGNPVVGITVVFELPAGASGTFGGSADVVTGANGVAMAPALMANTIAGTFTVDAWVAGVAVPAACSLTNTAGPAASISPVVSSLSGTVGKPYATALQALVTDSYGNPVSGAKVTVTVTAGGNGAGGKIGGSSTFTATTAANGVAKASLTANTIAGTFAVSAAVNGANTPAAFSLTNLAGPAAKIVAVTGTTPQTTTTNSAFPVDLGVVVTDSYGNDIADSLVTFTVHANAANGAGAAFSGSTTATATTKANGVATAPLLTANAKKGSFTVIASIAGVAQTAMFALMID